jgi:hypothetical protein
MGTNWLPQSLKWLYEDWLESFEIVLRECPDPLWTRSVWDVRLDDRHVWPIVRGMGAELPDHERLQLHSAFCNVSFHILFWFDHYLGGGLGAPTPPPPFRADEQDSHVLPERVYTREELLAYLHYCRAKAAALFDDLDDDRLEQPARIGRPFGDLMLNNLIQLATHTAQLQIFLSRDGGWSDPRWRTTDRWFQPCEHCPPQGS